MKNNQRIGMDFILKRAFFYWSKTLLYQLLFSLLYFSILFSIMLYFAERFALLEQYTVLSESFSKGIGAYQEQVKQMSENENYLKFNLIIYATLIFLHPLNLGLLKIYRKIDLNEKIEINDLFAGYSGSNFFIYIGFYLFWFMVYIYTLPTLILAVVWVLVTLFSAPLMFFMNKSIIETLSLNLKALKKFPLEIMVCVFIALVFKYMGIFSIVGAVFTFPFWNAMIYALYSLFFNEIK